MMSKDKNNAGWLSKLKALEDLLCYIISIHPVQVLYILHQLHINAICEISSIREKILMSCDCNDHVIILFMLSGIFIPIFFTKLFILS